jgi:hypothetical protein
LSARFSLGRPPDFFQFIPPFVVSSFNIRTLGNALSSPSPLSHVRYSLNLLCAAIYDEGEKKKKAKMLFSLPLIPFFVLQNVFIFPSFFVLLPFPFLCPWFLFLLLPSPITISPTNHLFRTRDFPTKQIGGLARGLAGQKLNSPAVLPKEELTSHFPPLTSSIPSSSARHA